MSIEERIASLQKYFKEMKIAEGIIFIKVSFPKEWIIDKNVCKDSGVKITPCKDMSGYYFFGDSKLGIDTVFDIIEKVVEINKIAELKKSIFQEKIKELEQIFIDEDISVLSTLEFKFKKKRPKKKVETENETKNIESNNLPESDSITNESNDNCDESEQQKEMQMEAVNECQTS